MKRLITALALSTLSAIMFAGCATTPTPPAAAKAVPPERLLAFQSGPMASSGKLIIVRDSGLLGSGCYFAVAINGTTAARLDVGERSSFLVPVGEVLLRVGRDPAGKGLCAIGQDDWTQRETLIKQGETKYFRVTLDASGKADIQRGE